MVRPLFWPVVLLALSGCARERAPAPDDVDALSRFLFTNWEDERLVQEAMTNMTVWLEDEGTTEVAREEGYRLDALSAEEIGPLEYPTRTPLSELIGVAVSGESPHPIEVHAELVTLRDQTWNARQYDLYDRVITEGSADAFLAEGAHEVPELIRTDNDIEQERLSVRIGYRLIKNYRWTEIDDGRRAVVARTWAPEIGCSNPEEMSGNCLELSFSVDLFVEGDAGQTLRHTSSWNRTDLSVNLGDDLQVAALANGIIDIFEDTDEFIEEREED